MSTNKTPNYQLNQWVKTDQVLMEEFNADNSKIDAELNTLSGQVAAKADQSDLSTLSSRVTSLSSTVSGKASQSALNSLSNKVTTLTNQVDKLGNCAVYHTTYTGKGSTTTTITFPRKPLAVYVVDRNSQYQIVFAVQGMEKAKMATTVKAELIAASWSGNSLTYTTDSYIMSLGSHVYDVFALLDAQ